MNFPLKSSEIPVGLRFQLASVTINFTDNRDYRAVLYSMVCTLWHSTFSLHRIEALSATAKYSSNTTVHSNGNFKVGGRLRAAGLAFPIDLIT